MNQPADPKKWPLGINPTMDSHAERMGLGHWSAASQGHNSTWVRRDGFRYNCRWNLPGGYPAELREVDASYPMGEWQPPSATTVSTLPEQNPSVATLTSLYAIEATDLVYRMASRGLVLTVEQKPRQPPGDGQLRHCRKRTSDAAEAVNQEDLRFDLEANLKAKALGLPPPAPYTAVEQAADAELPSYRPLQPEVLRKQRKRAIKQAMAYHSLLSRTAQVLKSGDPSMISKIEMEIRDTLAKPSRMY